MERLAFDDSGASLDCTDAVTGGLVEIDPLTGAGVRVGPAGPGSYQGLSIVIPESSTAILIGLGLCALTRRPEPSA